MLQAVIGAGVLSLAYSSATVGWIAAPIMQLMFAAITLFCSYFLADCYRYPGPTEGVRQYSYPDAVRNFLGTLLLRHVIAACVSAPSYNDSTPPTGHGSRLNAVSECSLRH